MGDGERGIKAVAHAAGVSVGSVSNVLNHPDRVTKQTAQRVRAAIDSVGYVRNEAARHLRAGSSRVLGLVVLDVANPFFADVATGVEEVADERHCVVAVANSSDRRDREARHLETLLEQRVQGLLITPLDGDLPILDRFADLGIPVVFVDRQSESRDVCSVTVDDLTGGRLAGRHLLEVGRHDIAYLGGPRQLQQVHDRLTGLRQALETYDGAGDPIVMEVDSLTLKAGSDGAAALLDRDEDFDAIFAANDLLALGALRTLITRGIRVPEEVAVVGYDDIEFAGGAAIPLTSVRQPRAELGRTAARLLFEEVDQDTDHTHRTIRFTPDLVVRESSARADR